MSFPDFSPTNPNVQWQRFCDLNWFHGGLGIWLDISRMQFNSTELEELTPSVVKAFQAISELEGGAIANKDENRQVGHYWLRSPDLAPDIESRENLVRQIEDIETFGSDVLTGVIKTPNGEKFTDVLWIGIGGSGLGPLLMVKALQEFGSGLSFHFLDNVDPLGINKTLQSIGDKLKTTLVVTVSKSGGTPEPKLAMEKSRSYLEKVGGQWPGQSVAITMINSKLDNLAKSENWLKRFDLPDWVGGRTSITSAVGLLPGALIGINIRQFLSGAAQMDEASRVPSLRNNPSALLAASWFLAGNGVGKRDMVVLPYRDQLEVFSRYLQQLVMESLGKRNNRDGEIVSQGISVYGNKGSTDQHAYVQQLRDGLDNFFVNFVEILEDSNRDNSLPKDKLGDYLSGFLQGTRSALTQGSRNNLTITMVRLDPPRLGALIALFERAVGLYAEMINVNAYDQPGVEAGKLAAAEILDLQEQIKELLKDGVPRTVDQISKALGKDSNESIFLILRHLCFNDKSFSSEGDWQFPATLRFSKQN